MFRSKFAFLLIGLVSMLAVQPAQADQMEGRMYLGPQVGYNFPVGELNSFVQGSWSAGGVFEYMTTESLAWGIVGMYHSFDIKDSALTDAFGTTAVDASYDIIEVGISARKFWRYSGSTTRNIPYLRVSLGVHHKQGDAKGTESGSTIDESISESSFASVLGFGMQLAVGKKHGVDLQIAFHHLFDNSVAHGFEVGHSQFWLFSAAFLFGLGPDAPESE